MIKNSILKEKYSPFTIKGVNCDLYLNPKEDGEFYICDVYNFLLNGSDTKNKLISFIIKVNYPADRMDAIRNNYELVKDGIAGDKAEEYTQEYLAMQDWRAYSKELAKEIIDSKENDV